MDAPRLAPPILRSWERCQAAGIPQTAAPPACARPPAAQQLLALARSSIEDLYQPLERPGFAVLLADAQAVVLDVAGDLDVLMLAYKAGLRPPVSLAEEHAGTNAVDLALREAQPLSVAGAEHYSRALASLAMAAAPIFDGAGLPLGVLAIVTASADIHPHTQSLAIAAVQALHNQLRADQLLSEANDQLAELYATLETMSDGLIFIGPEGEIRRINSHAAELLGLSARAVAGRDFAQAMSPPALLRIAIERREELSEVELLWQTRREAVPLSCGLRPVWDRRRRYLGALITLRPTHSLHRLVQRVVGARAELTFRDVIGQSPPMVQALHQAHLAASASGGVLLRGEPGVGKDLFAQAIHNASGRAAGPFVRLSCATVPRPLLEGELFGVAGDPARADQPGRPGKLELAQGGVLFLEDVTELTLEMQTRLLRAIEMGGTFRTGGTRPLPLDVRIICTGADIERQVYEGRFRADLAARLCAFNVDIPPLRRRGDDLLLLVSHLLRLTGERLGRPVALAPEALQALRAYPWPGNVRELELTLERAAQASEKSVILVEDLPAAVASAAAPLDPPPTPGLAEHSRLSEREAILRAGRQSAGNVGRTAETLGISRATLWRKMRRYGIARADFFA